jgi:hypothetical protein
LTFQRLETPFLVTGRRAMMQDGAMMGGLMGLGWFWMLLIGLLVVLAIAALIKYLVK